MLQKQRVETVLLSTATKEELAHAMTELIKNNNEVRMALINLMCASPYIVTRS